MTRFCLIIFTLAAGVAHSQKIDNMVSFRDMGYNRTFRISYDNDFFTASDRNYTQGYSFMTILPALSKNPVNHLFLKPENSDIKFGLGFEHIGFTPRKIGSEDIQFGERPFAAAAMLKSFAIATDSARKLRLVSSLNVGIIGPAALGNEIQTAIHKAIDNVIPRGWQHQISNDLVLNYEISIEKNLIQTNFFSLQTSTYGRVGTLQTNASAGFSFSLGKVNHPFGSNNRTYGFQLYVFAQPLVNAVAYDATLNGGLFNTSVYTIPQSDMERFTGQVNFGVVLQTKKLYFEYASTRTTREFSSGEAYKWGGLKLGFWI